MKYKIDSDVPLPPARLVGREKYPFRHMKVGESIASDSKNIRSAVSEHKKRNPGFDYATRQTDSGYRVWCLSTADNNGDQQ